MNQCMLWIGCVFVASDGQHIYMHAVNIRCLVKQYGSLRQCPPTITASVVETESASMDEVPRCCAVGQISA